MLGPLNCRYLSGALGLLVALALPASLHAQQRRGEDGAILAITLDQGQGIAGMMCYARESGSVRAMRDLLNCPRPQARRGDMCRRSNATIVNTGILAFDVTTWSRQAISELADTLGRLEDPLNHDFAAMKVAGRRLSRIDEDREDGVPPEHEFQFGFGRYLLMKIPVPASGT